jgi:hypothetical protein
MSSVKGKQAGKMKRGRVSEGIKKLNDQITTIKELVVGPCGRGAKQRKQYKTGKINKFMLIS